VSGDGRWRRLHSLAFMISPEVMDFICLSTISFAICLHPRLDIFSFRENELIQLVVNVSFEVVNPAR
jgi:hypothetical protein